MQRANVSPSRRGIGRPLRAVPRRMLAGSLLAIVLAAAVGIQGLERARFAPLPRSPLGLEQVTLHETSANVEGGSTFGRYTAIRSLAPGATLFVEASAGGGRPDLYFQELGLIASIVPVDLSSAAATGIPTQVLTGPGWRLLAADGAVAGLALLAGPDGEDFVDVRLTSGWDVPELLDDPVPDAGQASSLGRTVVVDVVVLLALLLGGGLLLPRPSTSGPLRFPLALLAGTALQASLGLLLLPWRWASVMFVATAGAAWLILRRRGISSGWSAADVKGLVPSAVILSGAAVLTRMNGWTITSNDSFTYWTGARALAGGRLSVELLDEKRGLALQSLHAPGFGLGADGVLTLGPALLIACVAVLALLPWHVSFGRSAAARLAGVAVAALVASSGWFWFTALYLNSHLLVAGLLLLVTVLAVLGGDRGGVQGAMLAIGVALVAVVLARTEAVLLVSLVLLGTLVHRERWEDWRWAWWSFGAGLLAWNGLLALGARGEEGSLSVVILAGLAAGAGALLAPSLLRTVPAAIRIRVPITVGLVLWAFTLAIALTPLGERVRFFEVARLNLGEVAGQWYLTAPLILLLGAFGLAVMADAPSTAPARWLTIGLIPSVLIARLLDGAQNLSVGGERSVLDLLLSGGGRLGWGDSSNRMWTHGALVALLLVIIAARGHHTTTEPDDAPTRRSAKVRPATVALISAVLLTAVWWQPDHLGPVGPAASTTIVDTQAETPGPELTTGTSLVQRITLPSGIVIPEDTDTILACADVTFTDLGRANSGAFTITISEADGQGRSTTERHNGRSQRAGSVKSTCVELDPTRPLPEHVEVRLTAISGNPDASVAPMLGTDGGIVSHARVDVIAASLDPRSSLRRAVSWTLRAAILQGPLLIGLGLLSALPLHDRRPRPASHAPQRASDD